MAITKDRVKYAADTAKPYFERALTDDEFRQNLRSAFAAARAIYDELGGHRGLSSVASRVASDDEIHSNLRRAIGELRQAADRIQAREEQQAKTHSARNAALLATGVVIGVFFNPLTGPATRRFVARRAKSSGDGTHTVSTNGSSG